MTGETFNTILEARLAKIKGVLASKGAEYASGDDRLYNFKRAGAILRKSPKEALLGMLVKHLVSVLDIIEAPNTPTPALVDEKVGDAVNYLILLEALLLEYSSDARLSQNTAGVGGQEKSIRF